MVSHTLAPEYHSWAGIKKRCYQVNDKAFGHYGGRGIKVCDRWRFGDGVKSGFACFLADLGPRPSSQHSLDRYPDKNGNYEPGNVRWATKVEQMRNRITNRIVVYNGASMPLSQAAEEAGLPYDTVWDRIAKKGWSTEAALQTPVQPRFGGTGPARFQARTR